MSFIRSLVLGVVLLIPSGFIHAASFEFWVDEREGDDAFSGSYEEPFQTIDAAIDAAGGSSALIFLAEGEYDEGRIVVREEDEWNIYLTLLATIGTEEQVAGVLEDPYSQTSVGGEVIVDIDMGAEVVGDVTWNGVLMPPVLVDAEVTIPGYNATTSLAVSIGSGISGLSLSTPARIVLEDQEGKQVGWIRNGDLTEITDPCELNPSWQDGVDPPFTMYQIPEGSNDCVTEIEGQSDLYIWTNHFTTFIAYESSLIPVEEPEEVEEESSGGSSRGPSGRSGQKKVLEEEPVGQVLGASSYNFTVDLAPGATGPDVVALQEWLKSAGYSVPSGATGFYGNETYQAVMAFQRAQGSMPITGTFGPMTRAAVMSAGTPVMSTEARLLLIAELLKKVQELQKQFEAMEE